MILTAMVSVVLPRIEMALSSITGLSWHQTNGVVQNSDQRVFSGNIEDNPFMTASGRKGVDVNHSKNDETRNKEAIGDGDFPTSRSTRVYHHTKNMEFIESRIW